MPDFASHPAHRWPVAASAYSLQGSGAAQVLRVKSKPYGAEFLGNMSYVAAEKLFKHPEIFNLTASLIVLALILHYVMDWTYTTVLKKEQLYPPLKFLADAVIVVCLYVAMRLALQEDEL